jgi:hypothetical protein
VLHFGDKVMVLPPPPPLPAIFDRQNLELDPQSSEIVSGTFEKLVECLFDGTFGSNTFSLPTFCSSSVYVFIFVDLSHHGHFYSIIQRNICSLFEDERRMEQACETEVCLKFMIYDQEF